jgi:hypothetical protein
MRVEFMEHLLVICHLQDGDAAGTENGERKINFVNTNCEGRAAPALCPVTSFGVAVLKLGVLLSER